MADTIERLEVLIEANTKAYENAMKKLQSQTTAAFKASTASVKELDSTLATLAERGKKGLEVLARGFAGLAEAAGLSAAFEIGKQIKETMDWAREIVALSEKIGISTDKVQQLSAESAKYGIDMETMSKGLTMFTKNAGLAADGQGKLSAWLKANHATMSGDTIVDLQTFANLVNNTANEEQRMALEQAGLGRSGSEVDEMLKHLNEGLKTVGDTIDEKTLKQAAELDEAWLKFAHSLETTVKEAILGTTVWLGALGEAIVEADKTMPLSRGSRNIDKYNASHPGQYATGYQPPGTLAPGENPFSDNIFGARPLSPGADNPFDNAGPKPPPHTIAPVAKDPKIQAAEDAYKKLAAAIGLETTNLTASSREQFIANEAAKLGADATPKQIEGIQKVAAALYDQKKALEDNRAAADLLANAMFTALNGIVDGSSNATDALKKMVAQLLLAGEQALLLGTGPLAGLLGTAPATAGAPAGLLGTLGSAIIGAIPHFAAGGTLGAGQVGLVGERGPELIRGPATITPGRGGGGHVIVELVESPMLRGVIRQEATGVAVKITRSGIDANAKATARARELAA